MPTRKTNGIHIALDNAFNPIVRYQVAASRSEADEVIALLPLVVSDGLVAELDVCNEAHRYDLEAKRAYCFRLEGERLHIWIWNEVETYVEAGDLLSLIVSLEKDLSAELANEVYARATGRSVNQPGKGPRGELPDES